MAQTGSDEWAFHAWMLQWRPASRHSIAMAERFMGTNNASAAPSRPLWWLHLGSWLWLVCVFALLFLAILPGTFVQPVWANRKIQHGWPWIYAVRDLEPGGNSLWSVTTNVVDFY